MSNVVEVIQQEIEKREAEIDALKATLKVLTGSMPKTKQKTRQIALPSPEKPEPKSAGDGNYTVNGTDMVLTENELQIATALSEADDCCSVDYLTDLCGNRQNLHNRVYSLNKKLKAAGAEIQFFKGEGYRLQNIEAA
jgi:hypothetical protein